MRTAHTFFGTTMLALQSVGSSALHITPIPSMQNHSCLTFALMAMQSFLVPLMRMIEPLVSALWCMAIALLLNRSIILGKVVLMSLL